MLASHDAGPSGDGARGAANTPSERRLSAQHTLSRLPPHPASCPSMIVLSSTLRCVAIEVPRRDALPAGAGLPDGRWKSRWRTASANVRQHAVTELRASSRYEVFGYRCLLRRW